MHKIAQRLRSKTYWAAVVGTLLMVLEQNSGILSAYLGEALRPLAVVFWPVLMVALREVTTTALDDK